MVKEYIYPCENGKSCSIKKAYAKLDFHWFDHEDCPYECPYVKKEEKDDENHML